MLFLAIASVATITRATMTGHWFPLETGTYEMEGHNAVDTSLAGMKMEVKQSQRMATVANFTFEHDDGTRYYTDDARLQRLLRKTLARPLAVPEFMGTCYHLDTHHSSAESLKKAVRPFYGLRRVRASNIYVCPTSSNAVTLKLLQADKTYADVMLVRTVQGIERKKLISPGRYLKAHVQATKFEELVGMEIKVSKGRPGKQTANITFYHREKGEYSIYELPLKTYFDHADRFVNVDGYRDRCYGMRDANGGTKILTDQFAEVAGAFGKDLPCVALTSAMICVEGEDSISFNYRAQWGDTEFRSVNLALDSTNLHMLAEAAIEEPQPKRRRIDRS